MRDQGVGSGRRAATMVPLPPASRAAKIAPAASALLTIVGACWIEPRAGGAPGAGLAVAATFLPAIAALPASAPGAALRAASRTTAPAGAASASFGSDHGRPGRIGPASEGRDR